MLMVLTAIISIGILIFIHEGGHFLVSRAFGVRVTEFMIGLPGPNIGFWRGGTKFGLTCVPLGGYARVCGMSSDPLSPHMEKCLTSLYRRGTATFEEVAADANIEVDEAEKCLEELVEWGSAIAPKKDDKYNTYRTPEVRYSKSDVRKAAKKGLVAPQAYEEGSARLVGDEHAFFESEYNSQYRSKSFWKRCSILLAGIAMNILFAFLAFLIVYSVIGVDVTNSDGTVTHMTLDPMRSLGAGCTYIALTFQAICSLFNPATAADTVSNSTSIVGIAVLSADYFARGISDALLFMAMISVSLGLMNLLPIPPLDGGHFLVEVIEKITRRNIPERVVGYISSAGVALMLLFFVIMVNQDIQRFIFGNW